MSGAEVNWAAHIESVARYLCGEPNKALSHGNEMRFGTHGSLCVRRDKGTWYDHEAEAGGGVLDLVRYKQDLPNNRAAVEWLQSEMRVQMPEAESKPGQAVAHSLGRVVETYDYWDEAGEHQLQVVRFEPKDFRQRRHGENSEWVWNVRGVKQVPYRLPQLLAKTDEPVWVVEGEKDVHALERLGLLATCNAGGAGKWRKEFVEYFRGRVVGIIPDNDDVGRDHAADVARSLIGVASDVRIIELPGLPEKGDVSDWIAAGGTREQLMLFAGDAKPLTSAPPQPAARVIDLEQAREKRDERGGKQRREKSDEDPLISRIGDAVIAGWEHARGPIAVIGGTPYTYAGGVWEMWEKAQHYALRVEIQRVLATMRIEAKTQLLNAVYRYVIENPQLMREGVQWDASGLIVCQDVAIDPLTRATCEHSPDHWATTRVEVRAADMRQGCPQWLYFLDSSFSNLVPDDRAAVIATLQEWIGAALVKRKPRELRKALWLYGESRTGKSRVSEVMRLLIGEPTCGLKIRALEKNFGGSALLGKRAWIADDAVGTNDEIDDAVFKVIVTGEVFSTDVKNAAHETVRLDIPVLLTSNPLPKVRDQSDAVFNRSLLIPMRVVRSEEETAGVKPIDEIVAQEELAGVFAWALDGWARAIARGRFDPPKTMREASDEFKAANNVVDSWAKECVISNKNYMLDRRDVYASFKGWYIAEFGEGAKVPSAKFLIGSLRQVATLGQDHKSAGARYLTGISLSEDGLIYRDEGASYGEQPGSGCKRDQVNKTRPYSDVDQSQRASTTWGTRF